MNEREMKDAKRKIALAIVDDDRSLRTDYSGRGMFGRTCWGVTCNDPNDVIAEVGLKGAQTDNMGTSTIVYWPRVTGPLLDE